MAWSRFAFMLPADAPVAPATDPPPGPYWVMSKLDDVTLMLAFLPDGVELEAQWPKAFGRNSAAVRVPQFHAGLPRPTWWTGPGEEVLPKISACPPLDGG